MKSIYIGLYQGLSFQFKSFEESKTDSFSTIRIITDRCVVDPLLLKLLERDVFNNMHKSSLDDYKFDKTLTLTKIDTFKTQAFLNIDIFGYSLPDIEHHASLIGKAEFAPSEEGELIFGYKKIKHYSKP